MGRLMTFIIVLSGVTILMYMAGITGQTGSDTVLGVLLNPESVSQSEWWGLLSLIGLSAGVVAGVTAFLTKDVKTSVMSVLIPPAIILLWQLFDAMFAIIAINRTLGVLLVAPLSIYFIFLIVDWWRGSVT